MYISTGNCTCIPNGHPLTAIDSDSGSNWYCDMANNRSLGCARGCTRGNFDRHPFRRYRCQKCNFDLCDLCADRGIPNIVFCFQILSGCTPTFDFCTHFCTHCWARNDFALTSPNPPKKTLVIGQEPLQPGARRGKGGGGGGKGRRGK